jgi:DNA-binding transcriptional LysR family regulator
MHEDHHRRFDLNLLDVFDALMRERHAGRAGERLGLTQPAISHALGRMRDLVGDPLFVKYARGMKPTPRAEILAASIVPALATLRTSLAPQRGLDPKSVARTIVIGASDYIDLTLIPAVTARLRQEAPLVDLRIKATSRVKVVRDLRRRDIDLAIGPLSAASEGVDLTPLFKERFVMIARKGHPALKKPLSLERFAALHHLLVSPSGDPFGIIDQELREIGLTRRIVITVPHFLAAPFVVETTDLVAVMPERVAKRMRPVADIGVRDIPLDIPPWTVGLARPKDTLVDSFMEWLVRLICATAAELPA